MLDHWKRVTPSASQSNAPRVLPFEEYKSGWTPSHDALFKNLYERYNGDVFVRSPSINDALFSQIPSFFFFLQVSSHFLCGLWTSKPLTKGSHQDTSFEGSPELQQFGVSWWTEPRSCSKHGKVDQPTLGQRSNFPKTNPFYVLVFHGVYWMVLLAVMSRIGYLRHLWGSYSAGSMMFHQNQTEMEIWICCAIFKSQ